MERKEIATFITAKLQQNSESLKEFYHQSGSIPYFFLDDLLPKDVAEKASDLFPNKEEMVLKKSLKEDKYVSAQMNLHPPLIEEILFAFQDPRVIKEVEYITGIPDLLADEELYAGGISLMAQGQYLKPHLDNSHDKDRQHYRVLNLLYYLNPDWNKENGGNLEIWPEGIKNNPVEITSQFNRLVVMATHRYSLHSVNEVKVPEERKCISNYYFSVDSPEDVHYFHVTSFYGRHTMLEKFQLKVDRILRNLIRKTLPKNIFKNPHYYKKSGK